MTPILDTKGIAVQDLDTMALSIIEDLLAKADLHFEHRPIVRDAPAPVWLQDAVRHVQSVHDGRFPRDAKLPASWLEQHARRVPLTEPMSWDQTHRTILHAAGAMLSDPTYRKGSLFFPESIPDWFVTVPQRKPRWSCFLRYANAPQAQGAPLSTDLVAGCMEPGTDKATLRIQQIRNSMDPDAVAAVERVLRMRSVTVYQLTGWERAGKLYGWWQGAGKFRDQFGDQEGRPEVLRHGTRWDKVLGTFRGLVVLAVEAAEGRWTGWFPVPGEPEWERFADWVAREHGVWIVEQVTEEPRKHEQGKPGDWERAFALDP